MCTTCGCSDGSEPRVDGSKADGEEHRHDHAHAHDHTHDHMHDHAHHHHSHDHSHENEHSNRTIIKLEQDVLAKNNMIAAQNRGFFAGRGVLALNLVSSPGSGKTSLLERTIVDLSANFAIGVIEGDQETDNDAQRIRSTGCQVVQINTGSGCHLEADTIAKAVSKLAPQPGSILFIENVGNLVCPALFDLGEAAKVAILSVTEGEDKPLKYPHMFRAASVLLVNKIDLLPHLKFDIERCISNALSVNPALKVFRVSAQDGSGLAQWYDWLKLEAKSKAPV